MKRHPEIDLYRGIILCIMALDHVSGYVMRFHYSEYWSVTSAPYHSLGEAYTRYASHLCATGFFFLMGMSMVFWQARHAQDQSKNSTPNHFFKRGLLLITLQMLVINPIWLFGSVIGSESLAVPGTGKHTYLYFGVISALGMCMMFWGVFLRQKPAIIFLISISLIVLTEFLVPNAKLAAQPINLIQSILFIPGHSQFTLVLYPLAPWLGISGLGIVYGWYYRQLDAVKITGIAVLLAGIFILDKFVITTNTLNLDNLVDRLYVIKYPPSLAYLSSTLLICVMFLQLLKRNLASIAWLNTIGRSSLFFYIAHLIVYILLVLGVHPAQSLWYSYLIWLAGLVIMYYLCRYYLILKSRSDPSSLLRILS